MSDSKEKDVPSEMVISEKWDTCLERTVINFGVGFVAGGLGSLVLALAMPLRVHNVCCFWNQADLLLLTAADVSMAAMLLGSLSSGSYASPVDLRGAPSMRRAIIGFGAGCGVGSSWVQCSQDFAKK